ncbi:hypothetical protein N7491_010834 [Penicillium cf. griseofulvum]|uniref:Hydrophobin n=1 Tax=Penicillium cf. griseofulvum TaxID=2972120 RepID=A0A9W9N0J0_9EURO|nr:hypothetical protein N7472_001157 [Penicillium cf. griseofulvum]KAJ5422389.1 hypothetical protein N7491_010834 [Penicillium cf. griseofulvum]KAJ5428571.1 hypothetical protein N7445_010025 [Penicillium cf. griseofulvum]
MRVSAFAFAAVLSLVSAKQINMHCNFAEDHTGMIQQPYCCRDMEPARGNSKANQALDCDLLTLPQLCEDQSRPACCYTIGAKKICTSHVIFQNAEDI